MRFSYARVLLTVCALPACQDFTIGDSIKDDPDPLVVDTDSVVGICDFRGVPREADVVEPCNDYEIGSFTPWVEWEGGRGKNSTALAAVADLDGDGIPEIITNLTTGLGIGTGELTVYHGDTGKLMWKAAGSKLGYGSQPTIADLDGDGQAEILAVRALNGVSPGGSSARYSVGCWDSTGVMIWESDTDYRKEDFDYATGISVSDMNHDGSPEIIAGRVILHSDGTFRAKGAHGHGSYNVTTLPGGSTITEGSASAVADLDLDGVEEVIVGNAIYDIDGNDIWHNASVSDGMIAIANLDDDPEGEFVSSNLNRVTVRDTNGKLLWGPIELDGANIVSPAAVSDLDHDGYPEIIVAGGNEIVAFHHDGSVLWHQAVTDSSGATGASVFDFDGDGDKEVVYADEINVYAFDGPTGVLRFQSDKHSSSTMMDYPVIADVDGDGSAEIIVTHTTYGFAFTVYGAADGRWAPARRLWNQHAYSRNNVEDDLTIPQNAVQAFTDPANNSWHDATDLTIYQGSTPIELKLALVNTCEVQCDLGKFYVAVQPVNRSSLALDPGISVTVYVRHGGTTTKIETRAIEAALASGFTGDQMIFEIPAAQVKNADAVRVVIDDKGRGRGDYAECAEDDNALEIIGPFCAD